jgi:hypothetical protein
VNNKALLEINARLKVLEALALTTALRSGDGPDMAPAFAAMARLVTRGPNSDSATADKVIERIEKALRGGSREPVRGSALDGEHE